MKNIVIVHLVLLLLSCNLVLDYGSAAEDNAKKIKYQKRLLGVQLSENGGASSTHPRIIKIRQRLYPDGFDLDSLFTTIYPDKTFYKDDNGVFSRISNKIIKLETGKRLYKLETAKAEQYFALIAQDEVTAVIGQTIATTAKLLDYNIDKVTGQLSANDYFDLINKSTTAQQPIRLAIYSQPNADPPSYGVVPKQLINVPNGATTSFFFINDDGSIGGNIDQSSYLKIGQPTQIAAKASSTTAEVYPNMIYFQLVPEQHGVAYGWLSNVAIKSNQIGDNPPDCGVFEQPCVINLDNVASGSKLIDLIDYQNDKIANNKNLLTFEKIVAGKLQKINDPDTLVSDLQGSKIVITKPRIEIIKKITVSQKILYLTIK